MICESGVWFFWATFWQGLGSAKSWVHQLNDLYITSLSLWSQSQKWNRCFQHSRLWAEGLNSTLRKLKTLDTQCTIYSNLHYCQSTSVCTILDWPQTLCLFVPTNSNWDISIEIIWTLEGVPQSLHWSQSVSRGWLRDSDRHGSLGKQLFVTVPCSFRNEGLKNCFTRATNVKGFTRFHGSVKT